MLNRIFNYYLKTYIRGLETLGLADWRKEYDRRKILNRSLVILNEAKKRKLPIDVLHLKGKPRRFYRAHLPQSKLFFEIMPLGGSYRRFSQDKIDHKIKIKNYLRQIGAPVVDGFIFSNIYSALEFTRKHLDFPLVIKPLGGSLSRGVSTEITNEPEFVLAADRAKKHSPYVIIEKHLPGECFRSTIVNFKHIATVKRVPANILGTGKHTISDLVAVKNLDERRGERSRLDTTMHQLYLGKVADELLAKQGLDSLSVPEKGKRVFLHKKITLKTGADPADVTDEVSPETILLSEKIARSFDARVLGIDIIAQDISVPLTIENGAVIELNSFPYIDMHHFPYQGKPRNVAAAIWNMVLQS